MRTKKRSPKEPEERTRVVVKNFFNQEQLDAFAELLGSLTIAKMDAEVVGKAFCDYFNVKEKDRFLAKINPEAVEQWEPIHEDDRVST